MLDWNSDAKLFNFFSYSFIKNIPLFWPELDWDFFKQIVTLQIKFPFTETKEIRVPKGARRECFFLFRILLLHKVCFHLTLAFHSSVELLLKDCCLCINTCLLFLLTLSFLLLLSFDLCLSLSIHLSLSFHFSCLTLMNDLQLPCFLSFFQCFSLPIHLGFLCPPLLKC